MSNLLLNGRVAVVTGAAGGLGSAISSKLTSLGARIVVGLNRSAEDFEGIPDAAKYRGLKVDVTNRKAVENAVSEIETEFGGIDILVTAAGILQPPPLDIEAVSERQFDRIIDVNLKGTWNAVSLIGPNMVSRRKGSIVTIASITGIEAGPLVPYGPAKAAIIELTKSYAGAWGKHGVRVNCVAPGYVETPPLSRGAAFGLINLPELAAATAMERLATVNEVAEAVCFLASDKASAITGATLPVDCGALVKSGFRGLDRSS